VVPLLLLIFGFCPLVWGMALGGLLILKKSKNCPFKGEGQGQECSFSRMKCKPCLPLIGLGCLVLFPFIFNCCPLIWFLGLGAIAFVYMKKNCTSGQSNCFSGFGGCPLFRDNSNPNQVTIYKLHRASLECLDSNDKDVIQKGKEILLKIIELAPNDKIALYNLACAESLLGNVKEAVATLEKAIDAGYHNLSHMINDQDFNNIKNTEGFKNMVKKLEDILHPEQKEEISEPIYPKIQEKKKSQDPIESKLDTLKEIYPLLSREKLRELLSKCKGDVEEVVERIFRDKN